jgi:hypothetical protein
MSDLIKLRFPCDMTLAYLGDCWQDHRDRPGYLEKGWEPGLDILSNDQAQIPLVAVLPGKVRRVKPAGYNDGYGSYVEINHGVIEGHAYRTLCAHMANVSVLQVGHSFGAGQQIGLMGSTGNSDVVHVHFILWRDGVNVDPMPYLTGAVVTPPVEPPAPSGFKMPDVPALPKSVVYKPTSLITKFIRVRVNRPDGMMIDQINPGERFYACGWAEEGGDVWLMGWTKSGKVGWAAAFYKGETWLEPA